MGVRWEEENRDILGVWGKELFESDESALLMSESERVPLSERSEDWKYPWGIFFPRVVLVLLPPKAQESCVRNIKWKMSPYSRNDIEMYTLAVQL
jgi:hypothetical protein